MKKWEKQIYQTYHKKLTSTDLFERLLEKLNEEQEVKTIITDMKTKFKDLELLFRKKWHILKKFNLQEKIYREESKILSELEKEKFQEIFRDAIEKLEACHIGGFEPANVIKEKIFGRIQQKYKINQEYIDELRKIFRDPKYTEEEESLINLRHNSQISVKVLLKQALEKIIKNSQENTQQSFNRDYTNKNNSFLVIKQELKRFEKEIEAKSGKGALEHSISEDFTQDYFSSKKTEDIKKYTSFEGLNVSNFSRNVNEDIDTGDFLNRDTRYIYLILDRVSYLVLPRHIEIMIRL
jgi:hypothetical protein